MHPSTANVAAALRTLVWAAAGHVHTVFPTSFAELVRITNGTAADIGADA